MKTVTIVIFSFNELSKKAKTHAIRERRFFMGYPSLAQAVKDLETGNFQFFENGDLFSESLLKRLLL